jgi:hypothetical protein
MRDFRAPARRRNSHLFSLQAAAAARIAGKADIWNAAENGDLALVRDHVAADAACVNKRDKWFDRSEYYSKCAHGFS